MPGDAFHIVASFLAFEVAQYARVSKRFKYLVIRQLSFRTLHFECLNDFSRFDISRTRSASVSFTSIPEMIDLSHLTALKLYKSRGLERNLSNLLALDLKETSFDIFHAWNPINLRVLKINAQFNCKFPIVVLPMMPKLTSLHLKNLRTQFGMQMSHFPSLETLHIVSCSSSIVVSDTNFVNTNMTSVTIDDVSARCYENFLEWMLLQLSIRFVNIHGSTIRRILANVCSLNLEYSTIVDVPFVEMAKLTYLNVSDTRLTTPNFGHLPCLKRLEISNNDIRDLAFLKHLPSLVYLNCGSTYIVDLDAFSCLVHLEDLDLSYTPITKLVGLPNGLKRLSLRGCTKLGWRLDASKLTKLRHVNLKWTRGLGDISSLQNCDSLEKLKIAYSEVDLRTLSSWLPLGTRVDTKFYNFRKRKQRK